MACPSCHGDHLARLPAEHYAYLLGQYLGDGHISSNHWPCLVPHGPGLKHQRDIVLRRWQQDVVDDHPEAFVRGRLHSDGCRATNRVHVNGRWYAYPRYQLSNESQDIKDLFCASLDRLGIPWRVMNRKTISVARREGVARLDEFVGPKT